MIDVGVTNADFVPPAIARWLLPSPAAWRVRAGLPLPILPAQF